MARRKPKAIATMGEPEQMESLLSLFRALEDPRVERTRAYPLEEILFLVLCAVISGVNHLTEIETFGEAKLAWLRTILPYKNGVPSHGTIGRVLGKLDPNALEAMFTKWTASVARAVDGVVAIDGKTLRGAIERGRERSFIHMVAAFASGNSLVLGQVKTDEKSNEITAIPRLLELLHLKGAIVTIDAAGCQETILNQLVAAGGDFVIALRNNQPTLLEDIGIAFHDVDIAGDHAFVSRFETEEVAHGRGELRICETLDLTGIITNREKWPHVQTAIRVISDRVIKGKVTTNTRLFVSSIKDLSAERALAATRAHWSIENNLHWSLDVSFRRASGTCVGRLEARV